MRDLQPNLALYFEKAPYRAFSEAALDLNCAMKALFYIKKTKRA